MPTSWTTWCGKSGPADGRLPGPVAPGGYALRDGLAGLFGMVHDGGMENAAGDFQSELIGLLPRLRRFALVLCRNAENADDLLQATCERALSRRDQYTPGTRLDSWLYSIAHSIWKNDVRRSVTRARIDAQLPDAPTSFDGVRDVEGKIFLSRVLSVMEDLPQQQASVMMLVNVEGLSYAEAAEVLKVPVGTVMSRLARGRRALGEALAETGGETGNGGQE